MCICDGKNDFRSLHERVMAEDTDADQLDLAHRQSGMMLVFTLALIGFLLFATLGSIIGPTILFVLVIPIPFCIMIVRAYFRLEKWALPWVSAIWMLAIALCFLLMVVEFTAAIEGSTGTWGFVQGLLLLYLCWSMLQRLRLLRHPIFRAWYSGENPALSAGDISLQSGEVLAECPHCHSLLAVQPTMLGPNDQCPKCHTALVKPESVELYSSEEE